MWFFWQAKRILGYIQINNIKIDLNGEDIRSKESFKHGYGKDLLTIGNLGSNRIKNMKPHLAAITEILPDNPLCTYFEYFIALCNDYPKLRELDAITKNIYNFVARSKGTLMNSFVSSGGIMFSGNSLSPTENVKMFLATSIQTDNENEIKLDFEKHEKALKKADEEREKMLAKAAKMQKEMLEKAKRQQQETFEWAAKLTEEATRAVEKDIMNAVWMSGVGGMDSKDASGRAKELAKKSEKRETSRKGEIEKDRRDLKNRYLYNERSN